jgi:hypothetical protein
MRTATDRTEQIVVSVETACRMLDCKRTKLHYMINAGELETFKDGHARKITVESIHARVRRLLKQNNKTA